MSNTFHCIDHAGAVLMSVLPPLSQGPAASAAARARGRALCALRPQHGCVDSLPADTGERLNMHAGFDVLPGLLRHVHASTQPDQPFRRHRRRQPSSLPTACLKP